MNKNVKWIIGGGLATTFIIAAGLAIAIETHENHHGKSYADSWHKDSGHKGRHHMRFGKGDMTLEGLQTSLAERFTNLDSDGDGMISPEEFSAKAIERFMQVDADGNGTLTKDEIKQAHKLRKQERKASKNMDAAES